MSIEENPIKTRKKCSTLVLNPSFMRTSASSGNSTANFIARKAILNTMNPKIISSTLLDTLSPQNSKKPSIINYDLGMRRSQSYRTSFLSDSVEKQEQMKKKQQEWENFKKNPRYSVLEANQTTEQYPEEQLLEVAMILLQKPPQSRKINDIKILKKSTEKVAFFQTMSCEIHEQCLKAMKFQFYPKGKTVFELGTVGSTFYVILKGSVGVWVNIPKMVKEEKNGVIEEKVEVTLAEIKVLSLGASFGELALMEKKPRAATIRCKEDCCFAVLDKKNFELILKEVEQKKLYQQVEFFATMKIFSKWSYNAVKTLFLYTDQRKFILNQYVFKEGDEYDALYMVKSGEFEISVSLKIKKQNEFEEKNNSNPMNLTSKDVVYKKYAIAVVTVGETFGEEELIEKTKRRCNARCVTSSGELYMLNRKEFYRRVLTDESATLWLKKQIQIRIDSRKKRIQNFIHQELKFVVPKNKQNLNQYLGDFSQLDLNKSKLKIKNTSDDFSKKEIYSKPMNPDGDFFLPSAKGLEHLLKITPSPSNVTFDVRKALFQNSLSQTQEKQQGNSYRRFKLFMKEYDNNKTGLIKDFRSKSNGNQTNNKDVSQMTSPLIKVNHNKKNIEIDIPFIKKKDSSSNNAEIEESKKEEFDQRRFSEAILTKKKDDSSLLSPKIPKNKYESLPFNLKNKLQKEENERTSSGWLSLNSDINRPRTFSISAISIFGKSPNALEERNKINRFILDSIKGKPELQRHKKTVSFSFNNTKQKYQGNRYTTLFQNLC